MAAPRPQRTAPGARRSPEEGGRPAFVAAPKKGAHPALLIGLLALVVVTGGIMAWALITDKDRAETVVTEVETDNWKEWTEIKNDIREAERRFNETMKLRTVDGQHELFTQKVDETLDFISGVSDKAALMLDPIRNADGDVPPEYEGYLNETKQLSIWLDDLVKSSGF